jgi:hypothetical protein
VKGVEWPIVQKPSPELLLVQQDVLRGKHADYPLRTVFGWFGDDRGKARKLLRAAMKELNLRSRPDAGSASIRSTIVFFSAVPGARKPAVAGKHALPDVADIEEKLRRVSRTEENAPAPPPPQKRAAAVTPSRRIAAPKSAASVASCLQMVQEVRQTMICSVCDQEIPTRKRDQDMREVALFGAADFAVCCCCIQTVPKQLEESDAYRARWIDYRHRMRVSGGD